MGHNRQGTDKYAEIGAFMEPQKEGAYQFILSFQTNFEYFVKEFMLYKESSLADSRRGKKHPNCSHVFVQLR